jgi:hypothetical protein
MAVGKGSVREIGAALGVILSLVFVGYEISKNSAAVRGATFQAISDMAAIGPLEVANSDHLPALFARIEAEDPGLGDFTPEDWQRVRFIYLHTVRRLENVWVQVTEGVVDEGAFERFQPPVGYVRAQAFRDFWPTVRGGLSADFVAHFEQIYPVLTSP